MNLVTSMTLFVTGKAKPSNRGHVLPQFSPDAVGLLISSSCLSGTKAKGLLSTSHQHWVFVKSVTRGNSHTGIRTTCPSFKQISG